MSPLRDARDLNRDDDLKPGAPPRHATEPDGAEGRAKTSKTLTDPATGEPRPEPPRPSHSRFDDAG